MTIEIQEPDLEAIIRRRIDSGKFESPKDVIAEALRSSEPVPFSELPPPTSLMEAFERARGLGEGVDFSRERSPGRPVDM